MGWCDNQVDIGELIGKTISRVDVSGDEILFFCDTGEVYKMYHEQDCCESVYIDHICGDIRNLVGEKILDAYEVDNHLKLGPLSKYEDSYTWTFYRIRTMEDTIVIRWYGTSNGYYSERVDFVKLKEANTIEPQPYKEITEYLNALDKSISLKQQVLGWMDMEAKQGRLRTNGEAPAWSSYETSISALIKAQESMIPALRALLETKSA